MINEIWLNLPVDNLEQSLNFFKTIGFQINPKFEPNQEMGSIKVGKKNFNVMLIIKSTFEKFNQHPITNTVLSNEVLISLDVESKDEIDSFANTVENAGGQIFSKPQWSLGWIYGFGFSDLDGHRWNAIYMDHSKLI